MRVVVLCLLLAAPAQAAAGKPYCGEKHFCREMKDCTEAYFYFERCHQTDLDRDGDGVPCDQLCGFKTQH
ncbi:excalibur calcium-binding domain-containing protein [Zavarzinia sp.]|uniref:excalibur calcium-binding domain-containing protein n=1 Tax=Zavarzinia sp. TaxID=2027920 RepID=UPI003565D3F0